jgi:hypothetical protein
VKKKADLYKKNLRDAKRVGVMTALTKHFGTCADLITQKELKAQRKSD